MRVVTASRAYATDIDHLCDAVMTPDRIPRWFSPVTGDLRLGGSCQVEGNAGGTITACDAPRSVAVTWDFIGGLSWLDIRLTTQADGGTLLCLKHAALVDDHWRQFGPGATGVGWDLGLLSLQLHFDAGGAPLDREAIDAWLQSEGGKTFMELSAEGWGHADITSGEDPT